MTLAIPETSEELEEMISDAAKVQQLMKEGQFLDAIKAYAKKAMEARNEELSKQLKEGLQMGLAEWIKSNREGGPFSADLRPAMRDAHQRLTAELRGRVPRLSSAERALFNKNAPGVKADGIFDDHAEFFQATWHRAAARSGRGALAPKLAKLTEIQNSFGSEVPDAGGFLIPEVLRSELLSLAIESAVVRPRATIIPMNSLRVPIPIIDDTSHVSNIFGGVQWYWTEEAAALTESQATFGRVVLDAKKLTAYANVPNELLQDAPAFGGFFDARFPIAIAYGEDVAFFTGTGAGEPLGFINANCAVTVAKETGQATNTIVWENIVKMYSRMLPTSLRNAVWICAIDTFPELATMALSVGTGGGPVWIGNFAGGQGGADTPPMTILGRPVIFTEKAQPLSTAGDINFVDLSYYLIGDRMQMESMSSEHYKFANDQTSFRIIQRVDGRPWLQSALTPHNNSSNTLSAFVELASR